MGKHTFADPVRTLREVDAASSFVAQALKAGVWIGRKIKHAGIDCEIEHLDRDISNHLLVAARGVDGKLYHFRSIKELKS
jgi:hypothetical protein